MKKLSFRALLLCLVLLVSAFGLSACGKEKPSPEDDSETTASGVKIREVKLSGANFYDYFDYKEYPKYQTDEDGVINACELSYGFSLREGYVAANDPDHKDTLKVSQASSSGILNPLKAVFIQLSLLSSTARSWRRELP